MKALPAIAFMLGASLLLPVGFVAPKGTAPLFVLLAVVAVCGWISRWRSLLTGNATILGALAVFVGWALASALWAPDPGQSVKAALMVAGTGVAFLALARTAWNLEAADRPRIERLILLGIGFGLVWLAVDHFSGGAVTRMLKAWRNDPVPESWDPRVYLKAGVSITALAFWAWATLVTRRWGTTAGLAALSMTLVILAAGRSDTTTFALAIGALLAAVAWFRPRWAERALMAGLIALVLGAPLGARLTPDPYENNVVTRAIPNSLLHRIQIWRTTVDHIADAPLFGHGFDSTRSFYGADQRRHFELRGGTLPAFFEPIPLHPHNAALQVWVELGVVGILPYLLALLAAVRMAFARAVDAPARAGFAGFATTAALIANSSYGAWQSWWLCGIGLSLTLLVLAAGRRETGP